MRPIICVKSLPGLVVRGCVIKGRHAGREMFISEVAKEKQSEELRSEEKEEEEAFERLTKVDEEPWGGSRNELFYDLKNIKIGVWYQWNQGRLQIINDQNTTETLNAKLKTEGLLDNLELEA